MSRTCLLLAALAVGVAHAQEVESPGGRQHRVHALVGGAVVPRPGERLEGATVVVRDGLIEAVGVGIDVPADARVWDMRGLTLLPGFSEPYLVLDPHDHGPKPKGEKPKAPEAAAASGARHANPAVHPERSVAATLKLEEKTLEGLRDAGFTCALIAPGRGVLRGTSALVTLGDPDPLAPGKRVVRAEVAQHLAFESEGDGYPNSLMGSMALVRQTLLDAEHYAAAQAAYARAPLGQERPPEDLALRALVPVVSGEQPVCFEAQDAQMLLRGARLLGEHELIPWVVLGGHDADRWLEEVQHTTAPLILDLNFPPAPQWEEEAEAVDVSTEALRRWKLAPRIPALLAESKVRFAFTTHGLKDRGDVLDRVRRAVAHGLPEDRALAALTTAPAAFLGLPQLGVLVPGAIANMTVTDGAPFAEKTRVVETWIDGERYPGKGHPPAPEALAGTWRLDLGRGVVELKVDHEQGSLRASIAGGIALGEVSVRRDRVELSLPASVVPDGRGAVVVRARVDGRRVFGTWHAGNGGPGGALGEGVQGDVFGRIEPKEKDEKGEKDEGPRVDGAPLPWRAPWPPLPEPAPQTILVRGATVWTQGPQGTLEGADLLCRNGKVVAVGYDLQAPEGALVVDAAGKHVTPGLIDCHSHSFVTGRVNESSNNCTAEVRIADVLDAETVRIYQQLAGGLTTANVLHGSANSMGGQSAVVQLRWGSPGPSLLMDGAAQGIKFALGENPKRSNWGHGRPPRYPTSRMGVMESMRERFLAARDYEKRLAEWRSDPRADRIPPRIDLQLQALAEVLAGERLVHCHSYRQDEILALIRLADELGFTVGVFQHVLEGYKVADEIAAHGAGASTFSDWWGYKFEVYDAIAYNGALMHRRGVVVSFNSDSSELARRMNQEAAKAVRYGGLSPEEALSLVTTGPAKQLRVDEQVGSLEAGRQADFVVWSGDPLQSSTVCEQTWIAGRRYFERGRDRAAFARAEEERARLLKEARGTKGAKSALPADGWKPTFPPPDRTDHSCREASR